MRENNYIFHGCLVSASNTSCTQHALYHSITGIKRFIFQEISLFRQNSNWLSQTGSSLLKFSAQYSERGYVLCNLSTVCRPHHQDPRFIYFSILFSIFLTDPRSAIFDARSSILHPPSWFFSKPRRLFFISTIEEISCSKVTNAFKQ